MLSSRPAATRAATGSRPEPATATAIARASAADAPCGVGRVRGVERFAALGRTRHRARCGPLRVSWVPDPDGSRACVAYAIGRRVGPAVVRNRLRRRLRAILAQLRPPPGDYLVVADPDAVSLPFSDLKALVSKALSTLSPTSS